MKHPNTPLGQRLRHHEQILASPAVRTCAICGRAWKSTWRKGAWQACSSTCREQAKQKARSA